MQIMLVSFFCQTQPTITICTSKSTTRRDRNSTSTGKTYHSLCIRELITYPCWTRRSTTYCGEFRRARHIILKKLIQPLTSNPTALAAYQILQTLTTYDIKQQEALARQLIDIAEQYEEFNPIYQTVLAIHNTNNSLDIQLFLPLFSRNLDLIKEKYSTFRLRYPSKF